MPHPPDIQCRFPAGGYPPVPKRLVSTDESLGLKPLNRHTNDAVKLLTISCNNIR